MDERRKVTERPILEIVLTHYDEPREVGENFFAMLKVQRSIQWKDILLTIVQDGPKTTKNTEMMRALTDGLQCKHRFLGLKEHKGVSAARNKGIAQASGKWLMFCDFDDMFASVYSLREIIHVLDTEECDLLSCRFYDEGAADENGRIPLQVKYSEDVFVHGNLYRTSFLKEHKIHFIEGMEYCEDVTFNAWVNLDISKERKGNIRTSMPLYVWTCRPGSMTYDEEKLKKYPMMLVKRKRWLVEEYERRGMKNEARVNAIRGVYDYYFCPWRNEERDGYFYREFYRLFEDKWKARTQEDVRLAARCAHQENGIHNKYGQTDEKEIVAWLKELTKKEECEDDIWS